MECNRNTNDLNGRRAGQQMLERLTDGEWQELATLLEACTEDRFAAAVHHIVRTAGRAASSLEDGGANALARLPNQQDPPAGTRVLVAHEFYQALLTELRRRNVH
jgi:hypothetical protein